MRFLVFISLFLTSVLIHSQNITLSGYIKDADTGENLIGATIYDKETKNAVISNNYGFYSMQLPLDTLADVSVSYIGYKPILKYVACTENQKINFYLHMDNLLDEVILTATKEKPIAQRNEMSVLQIPISQVETLPALGGDTDIIKALQLMPGVQSGNEASSHLFVRGGSPDQNLILLDDVPLYYVNHLGGFASVFNTDALNSVKLIKGGFPARYGSRLSSIVDIRMKEGNNKSFQGSGMIGVIAAKLAVEGPYKNENTSYIISARRMLYDLITRPVSYFVFNKKASIGYHFYDFNAKINHKFSDNDRLFFSLYSGDDKLGLTGFADDSKSKFNSRWGNQLAAFRWNHIFNQRLFSNTSISYTRYRYLTENKYKSKENNEKITAYNSFKSAINDTKIKTDVTYYPHPNYTMKFGSEAAYHNFKPGVSTYNYKKTNQAEKDTVFGDFNLHSIEGTLYLENEISIGDNISANLGMRYNIYTVNNKTFQAFEPRALLNFLITKDLSIKSSYSKMQQNVHLLTSTGMGIPVDLWLPATDKVQPETSEQWALGIAKSISNGIYELSVEGYYKEMRNLITYKEGASYIGGTTDWQDKVETNGSGTSYGVELLLQKKKGKTTGWFGYTWAKSDRYFKNINMGKTYPFKYDRRHDLSIVVNHKLKDNIDFSGTWVYGTGNAYTLAIGKYEAVNNIWGYISYPDEVSSQVFEEVYIYAGKNNERMRDFHRLDIGFNFHKQKKRGERIWNVSIYNVYNRQNPYYYFFEGEPEYDNNGNTIEGTDRLKLKQQSLFPIIPSVSYSFKF